MDLSTAAETALLEILSERVEEDRREYSAEELSSECDIGFEEAEELAVALSECDLTEFVHAQVQRAVADISRMQPVDLKLSIVSGSWKTIVPWSEGDLATITRFLDIISVTPGGSVRS